MLKTEKRKTVKYTENMWFIGNKQKHKNVYKRRREDVNDKDFKKKRKYT